MSLQISCQSLTKSFSTQELFKDVSFGIHEGEKLGLIGPNGSGKSTLLKILYGLEKPDKGEVAIRKGLNLVYVGQTETFNVDNTIEEILLQSLPDAIDINEKYILVDRITKQAGFNDSSQKFSDLSGGWRKRVAIAAALIQSPDVLFMDEPTNHLDLEGILWLEALLKGSRFSYVLISHDRYFLENCTNRIIEINRTYPGGFFRTEGNYSQFLDKKLEFLSGQAVQEAALANRLRRETEWLRRGPKARTTKAKSRIDDAERLKQELSAVKTRNDQNKSVQIEFDATSRQTRKLIECIKISKSLGGRKLFSKIDLVLGPGSCLGIMGKNGSGKSTFIKLLTGELEPDEGKIIFAEKLKIVHFDQKRESLDPNEPLRKSLSPDGGDSVIYQGKPVHIATWAKRFLFPPNQLDMPVGKLSGGEQARILIARLMLQPADVLLLDEPTNDLDIQSLEVLEESLEEFPGAIVLITHDRFFLNRISDRILGLMSSGETEFFADYFQWQDAENQIVKQEKLNKSVNKDSKIQNVPKPKKLSFKEQKELDGMEELIHKTEASVDELQQRLQLTEVVSDPVKLEDTCRILKEKQEEVEKLYKRWEELEKHTI